MQVSTSPVLPWMRVWAELSYQAGQFPRIPQKLMELAILSVISSQHMHRQVCEVYCAWIEDRSALVPLMLAGCGISPDQLYWDCMPELVSSMWRQTCGIGRDLPLSRAGPSADSVRLSQAVSPTKFQGDPDPCVILPVENLKLFNVE